MRAAVAAEWIKLRSTRSPYACLASVVVISLGLAAAVGAGAAGSDEPLSRHHVLVGLEGYGLVIFMALAGLSVTGEYGSGTIRVTFAVLPDRRVVVVAKALVLAAVCAGAAAVVTPLAILVGGATAGREIAWDEATVRLLWGLPVIAGITAVIAVATGVLLRRTAAVLTTVIIWPLLIEGLTTLIPHVGQRIATFLPFANAHLFLGDPQGLSFSWPPAVGLAVFAGVGAVLLTGATTAVSRRDV